MLILTRRTGEAILMDGGVRIVVLETDSNGVRLGIEAPPSVGILREEVVHRIAEENIRAGVSAQAEEILRALTKSGEPQEEAVSGQGSEESGSGGKVEEGRD